jgi:hypothetical protein
LTALSEATADESEARNAPEEFLLTLTDVAKTAMQTIGKTDISW